jgi:heavy metal efflux system protein
VIERILQFSISQRLFVVLVVAALAALGVRSLQLLPIDAVPDITNNQVQINTRAPALSPFEVEKNVTLPIETTLAGIPGLEYTRSISRNAFSQVTVVFGDRVDVYFARTQVAQRLTPARDVLPQNVEPRMGPVSTGLGEIYMWTVEYLHPRGQGAERKDGQPAGKATGPISPPRVSRCAKTMNWPCICARCRTGSSGRS